MRPLYRSDALNARDGALAVAFAAVALVPALDQYGVVLGELPTRAGDAWRVLLVLAQTLPLAVRQRAPALCLAVVGTAFALDQCLAYAPSVAGLGVLFALYSVGAHQQRGRVAVAAASVVAYVCLAGALILLGSPETPWSLASFSVVLIAAWGVGFLVRIRAADALSRAEMGARAAVFEERARLARELHDVVSHHVTGMVVQADAATFLLPASEQAVHTQLAGIAEAGRSALDDLRRLLQVLGSNGAAGGPPIGSLTDLVAGARRAGQSVELSEHGSARGPDELRLAVYRVAQESLTNARKHAPGASVQVNVRWNGDAVDVRVHNAAGTAGPVPAARGSGRGLAGLRERADRLGGVLHAGPTDDGGYLVQTTLPVRDHEGAPGG